MAVNSEPPADSSESWENYARHYDRILQILPYYQDTIRRHLEALTSSGAHSVLDVGAGTGNIALPLAARGCHVVAVDVCPGMLDRLRGKLRDDLPGRIEVIERSAESLELWASESFDGVNALLSLFAMSRPHDCLSEIMRVLRPGGVLVITDKRRDFQLQVLFDFIESFLDEHGLRAQLDSDWQVVRKTNVDLDAEFLAMEEVEIVLRSHGFSILSCIDSHFAQCATLVAKKHGQAE